METPVKYDQSCADTKLNLVKKVLHVIDTFFHNGPVDILGMQ